MWIKWNKSSAVNCDCDSSNRKFFRMHFHMADEDDVNPDVNVTYRTINLYSLEKRFIYFISDMFHLIKTKLSYLSNSDTGRYTHYIWNNAMFIICNHIAYIFYENRECGLHIFRELTYEHVKLIPYSVINVSLAIQILS